MTTGPRQSASWVYPAVFVLACLSAVPASPAAKAAEPQWLKLSSPNFELYTTAGEKRARKAIVYFETIRRFFLNVLRSKQPAGPPIRIIAFRSEKEFAPFRLNDFSPAYYVGARHRDYIVMRSISAKNYPHAIHEYVHLIARHSSGRLPPWLDEGLAVLYASLEPIANKVRVGAIVPGHYQALRRNKWLDLETLTGAGHDSPHYNEKDRAGVFYAESWALVHMLYLSREYDLSKFAEFTTAIAARTPAPEAFATVYGKTLGEVFEDLRRYMRGDRFQAALFDVKLDKAAETPSVERAGRFESALVLADLLSVSPDKQDQARERYEKLTAEYPDRWQAHEGLAELALRSSGTGAARKHLARAIEHGSPNAQVYLDYAMLLGLEGEDDSNIIPILDQALALKPDFQDAHYRLGLIHFNQQDYVRALRHFSLLGRVDPERASQVFGAIAFAHQKLGQHDEALKAARRSLQHAREPLEIESAEYLLRFIESETPAGDDALAALPAARGGEASGEGAMPYVSRKSKAPLENPGDKNARFNQTPNSSRSTTLSIKGTLVHFECLGETARLRLEVEGKLHIFAILDPAGIEIRGVDDDAFQFTCGEQRPRVVVLGYERPSALQRKYEGIVRSIEFR